MTTNILNVDGVYFDDDELESPNLDSEDRILDSYHDGHDDVIDEDATEPSQEQQVNAIGHADQQTLGDYFVCNNKAINVTHGKSDQY